MRIVAISDIHGRWDRMAFPVPDGDVLIIAGDTTGHGTLKEAKAFSKWIESLPHEHKLMIAGNHDIILDTKAAHLRLYADKDYAKIMRTEAISYYHDAGIIYLQDSPWEIDGVKFYGSPWTPDYYSWAFMKPRQGKELKEIWDKIPDDTNILITHGPPFGILDEANDEEKSGCEALLRRVMELKNLKGHFFGHVHEGYGRSALFYNVAICNIKYDPVNPPTVFDLEQE